MMICHKVNMSMCQEVMFLEYIGVQYDIANLFLFKSRFLSNTSATHQTLEVRTWDVRFLRGLHRSRTPLLHLLLVRMVCSFWCLREQAPLGRNFFEIFSSFHLFEFGSWHVTRHLRWLSAGFLVAFWWLADVCYCFWARDLRLMCCFFTGATVDGEISGW